MSDAQEIRRLTAHFASTLALKESDPRRWAMWLIYLAECLEAEACAQKLDPAHPAGVELGFERLRDALNDRLAERRW